MEALLGALFLLVLLGVFGVAALSIGELEDEVLDLLRSGLASLSRATPEADAVPGDPAGSGTMDPASGRIRCLLREG